MPPLRTLANLALVLASLVLALFSVTASLAQQEGPSFKFSLFEVEGFVISDSYTIDKSFGERFELSVPVPFSVDVPRQDNVTTFLNPGDGTDDMQLKIDFVTGDRDTELSDRRLIENQRFVTMTLPMGPPEERLQVLARLLANDGFNRAVASYEKNEYIGTRGTKIGDYDAIEVVGRYVDPAIGLLFVRIVGIPNPDGETSIFSVANIVADMFELTGPDDLALTGSGKTLASFEYIGK
ncbi:MAG TPA: hypothetical protein ENJ90_11695 [Devosia sp.]|nr:hypothetical protein [Devosia sp.]